MTISIRIGALYDIESYDGLLDYIIAAMELDETTIAELPTLLRLAEYRLNRLCLAPEREVRTVLLTVAGQQYIDLPTGFRQSRVAYLEGNQPLSFVEPAAVLADQCSGKPQFFAIQNGQMWLAPTPADVYSIDLTYLEKLPGLTATNQSNWLLRGNADAYVYAIMFQVSVFLEDIEAAGRAEEELFRIIDEVNMQGNKFRIAGPLRMRPTVVV